MIILFINAKYSNAGRAIPCGLFDTKELQDESLIEFIKIYPDAPVDLFESFEIKETNKMMELKLGIAH